MNYTEYNNQLKLPDDLYKKTLAGVKSEISKHNQKQRKKKFAQFLNNTIVYYLYGSVWSLYIVICNSNIVDFCYCVRSENYYPTYIKTAGKGQSRS